MKSILGLLAILGLALASGCSSSEGKFSPQTTGGSTSTDGSTSGGAGGATIAPLTAPTQLRDSGLSGENVGLDSGTDASCFPFCDLTPIVDPNNPDPCMKAIPWVTGINTNIVAGDTVQYVDKLYKWKGKDPLTYTQADCIPTTTVAWCAANWDTTDVTCPIIDINAISDAGR